MHLSNATTNGVMTKERAEWVFANPKRSRRGNPVDHRRLFFFELYSEIIASRALFIVQNNNLGAPEYKALKLAFKEKGFIVCATRNRVFQAATRNYCEELTQKGQQAVGERINTMQPFFAGSTFAVFSNKTDEQQPQLLKDFADVATKFSDKAFVVGAKYDQMVLTADTLKEVMKLPPLAKSREELVGLLSYPSQLLVSVLQRRPQELLMALDQHHKNLEEAAGAGGAGGAGAEKSS
ncbi:hypothetical protein HK104_001621 [Borealophlyctis nickersoniae]|nr:hypothetical protein HK104_001621 [Borealophlyctis nickersoniae]